MMHYISDEQKRLVLWARAQKGKGGPATALTILRRMRVLLAREDSWTQNHYHFPKRGGYSHCLLGAWQYSIGTDRDEKARSLCILHSLIPPNAYRAHKRITRWNDDPGRTHADVLELLDRAIGSLARYEVKAA